MAYQSNVSIMIRLPVEEAVNLHKYELYEELHYMKTFVTVQHMKWAYYMKVSLHPTLAALYFFTKLETNHFPSLQAKNLQ
jgi:hypothetical protein